MVTVVEQQLPLHLLNPPARCGVRPAAAYGRLTGVDEAKRIPLVGCQQMLFAQLAYLVGDQMVNRMVAHFAKPVFGVGEVAFAAMHDAVPVASRGGGNALTNRVRLVEEIVP